MHKTRNCATKKLVLEVRGKGEPKNSLSYIPLNNSTLPRPQNIDGYPKEVESDTQARVRIGFNVQIMEGKTGVFFGCEETNGESSCVFSKIQKLGGHRFVLSHMPRLDMVTWQFSRTPSQFLLQDDTTRLIVLYNTRILHGCCVCGTIIEEYREPASRCNRQRRNPNFNQTVDDAFSHK
jgi:hypothetical protein